MEPEAAPETKMQGPCPVALVLGNDNLLAEILLRLDSPVWLVRTALVSTRWLRRASDPVVLRRFRARRPPRILALSLSRNRRIQVPRPPELAAAARRALATLDRSDVRDCRNGRLLIEVDDGDPATYNTYAVRRLLHPARDRDIPLPPDSISGSLVRGEAGRCHCRFLRLLEVEDNDNGDDTSCHCPVTELRQDLMDTIGAQKLLVGSKFYMMTTLGYILGLDLATASFFTIQLPDKVRNSRTLKFSGGKQSGLYLVDANSFQLRVWHGDGVGQWVLVDTISVREACGHLNVPKWEADNRHSAPIEIVLVADNAEFVIFDIVASEIVCSMQLGNRVVEKVAKGGLLHNEFLRPITMVWPPIFPVLDESNSRTMILNICTSELPYSGQLSCDRVVLFDAFVMVEKQ
ncbi:unnamed protein product [Urochloa decumbens]|uniref:F-box protein AT5G49610-like beta-propeller domain-containing protein n=1 Tax=Urochloa decumbens TaxID=240449 RepID=A0ABC8WX96_9POAL